MKTEKAPRITDTLTGLKLKLEYFVNLRVGIGLML